MKMLFVHQWFIYKEDQVTYISDVETKETYVVIQRFVIYEIN